MSSEGSMKHPSRINRQRIGPWIYGYQDTVGWYVQIESIPAGPGPVREGFRSQAQALSHIAHYITDGETVERIDLPAPPPPLPRPAGPGIALAMSSGLE